MFVIVLVLSGLFAGLLAGLFGIGGGLVIVPVIALLAVSHLGLSTGEAIHVAIATSITSILLTALGSIIAHHRRAAVHWQFLWRYTPWIAAGAWLATYTVALLSGIFNGRLLIGLFIVFALYTAIKLWRHQANSATSKSQRLDFNWPQDAGIGFIIGHISALLGIGGGSMNAPYFNWRGIPMSAAVGTAAACGYPIALAAALGFALQSLPGDADTSGALLGAIYWQAALLIGSCGLLAAPFGARLAHRLPEDTLRKVFAVFLLLLAIRMLWV